MKRLTLILFGLLFMTACGGKGGGGGGDSRPSPTPVLPGIEDEALKCVIENSQSIKLRSETDLQDRKTFSKQSAEFAILVSECGITKKHVNAFLKEFQL